MKKVYLVYVVRGLVKVRECIKVGKNFVPVDDAVKKKYRFHTRIPTKPMFYQYGKIYCENKADIVKCVEIVKSYYKGTRKPQLERSLLCANKVCDTLTKEVPVC